MDKEDFLQIFKSGFHKLTLRQLKKVRDAKTPYGRKYGVYLGLFEFEPPEQVWMSGDVFDYDFLNSLMKEFDEELSNCMTRKFTRKVYDDDELVKKVVTQYIFDIVPKNVLVFRLDPERKVMRLVVRGYCLETSS